MSGDLNLRASGAAFSSIPTPLPKVLNISLAKGFGLRIRIKITLKWSAGGPETSLSEEFTGIDAIQSG